MSAINYIDLFAGAGGLSEGFLKAGFNPIAHVEADKAATFTLKTRLSYHYLKNIGRSSEYDAYLEGKIDRTDLYSKIPQHILSSVINGKIGPDNKKIFDLIDNFIGSAKIDLIVGGPPCQAYSLVGRAPLKNKKDDERKSLYIEYGRFLKRYDPSVFVFENVPGLLSAGDGQFFKNLQKYFRRIGYILQAKTLNAKYFNVIQNRRRVIIIGWKKGTNFSFPDFEEHKTNYTRDDIFSDLIPLKPGQINRLERYCSETNPYLETTGIRNCVNHVSQHITRKHNENDLKIYRLAINQLKKGVRLKNDNIPREMRTQKNITDFLDRFKVVDSLPHTIIAHIAKDGHHYIHPDENQCRSLSIREAARIQSFPDNYFFEGVREGLFLSPAFRQIGNAVPPLMSEAIAEKLKVQFIQEISH